MTRRYQQTKRAAGQDETRRRIIEAAVELHEAIGPAKTTITELAERAGVGRLTVYRHFPDELSLISACSGLYFAQHPPPDPQTWRAIVDPTERMKRALGDSYAYHGSTEAMMTHALADVPDSPVMKPYYEYWNLAADIVASAWGLRGRKYSLLRATVGHALALTTWKSLVREQRLTDAQAIDLMLRLV